MAMAEPAIETSNEEMVAVRDFQRQFSKKLKDLELGEVEKLVLTRYGKMEAVVMTVEDYARLVAHVQ